MQDSRQLWLAVYGGGDHTGTIQRQRIQGEKRVWGRDDITTRAHICIVLSNFQISSVFVISFCVQKNPITFTYFISRTPF